eukprot:COSAG01_NODE_28050_length_670_cov_1.504378_1_plen_88_part_00
MLLWQCLGEGDCQPGQHNCTATATAGRLRDWEGVQTLPREVTAADACLDDPASADCALLVRAAPEVEQLRTWVSESPRSTDKIALLN